MMTISIIILALTCMYLLITHVVQSNRIQELAELLKVEDSRLDAQNAAIRELTNWNTDHDASIHNILDTIIGIDTEAQNITRNLIKTDNRVTEIERYYVTYVARKKVEDDGDQIQEKPVSDE